MVMNELAVQRIGQLCPFEHKAGLSFLYGHLDAKDLLCDDAEHLSIYAIEFIEACLAMVWESTSIKVPLENRTGFSFS